MPDGRGSLPDADTRAVDNVNAGRVRAILLLGGVPFDDLDDAEQQVRLKLLESQRSSTSTDEVRDVAAWTAVVASRVAVDWHRSQTRERSLRDRLAARWSNQPSVVHSDDDRALALSVADGLRELTPVQQEVLILRYYADLPVREISARLDVAEGTVKSRLNSAVAAIRTRLRDKEVI